MPYEFLEKVAVADIAFRAWGKSLEEVFVSSADATMNVMIDNLEAIEPRQTRPLRLENTSLDMLLFDFLQELIFYKDCEQLLLRVQRLQFHQEDGMHRLKGELIGEKIDPLRHQQRVDVKAVTLHQFNLKKDEIGWTSMVILDI